MKVPKSETILRFWGIFWTRLTDFRPKCSHQVARPTDKNKVHTHPIMSLCSNSCIAGIKVLESGTFLQFWGIFWTRLRRFASNTLANDEWDCAIEVGLKRHRIKVYHHPIIAVLISFVHFLRKSAKIGDNSSILGDFLNTFNVFRPKFTAQDEWECDVEGRTKRSK